MAVKTRFDLSSAYGQLIVLVFLPICVLAGVGAILVFFETMRASRSEQQAIADAALIRYEPAVKQVLPYVLEQLTTNEGAGTNGTRLSADLGANIDDEYIKEQLENIQSEQHLQRTAIITETGEVLAEVGYGTEEAWPNFDATQSQISGVKTAIGTAYGRKLGTFEGQDLWLFVDMDNEPVILARYRILLALAITGLITILLLLLSLNIYAKRWIAPIYEMRLHLQRMTVDNLYQPMPIESDGELNLLQQDLVKALRRLHSSFQELKNHAEQTEDDLRLAFDEMEMQNISIRNARDAAITTSQAKSAFLANISHELRTPLNSIDGFINLLARHGDLSAEQDLYVQTIRKSSAHLLALVNDVLDFSKIEAGKLVLDRHEFDLYDAIYDVVDMLSPVAAEKGLRMAVLFYHDVPIQIIGDALRMKQVLTNLVGNAIKFTDSGEVVVKVSLDEKRDNYLRIAIQDSGKGISTEDQKLLFQSFSQGDPSITRQYGGTGLGLVISQQLTRLMGGHIGFLDNAHENVANQGATFWFTMPTHVDVLEVAAGESMELPRLTALAHDKDEFHILVWINHTATIQVLKASLQPLPIVLTQASSLPSTLEELKEHGNRWDWVIVDSDTQDDMTALLKQIRLHYQGKLAVFGYQVGFEQSLLNRYHAIPLYQPLDKRQLYAMLDTQLKRKPSPTDAPRWQGHTVLAVDDHMPNLLVLDALLSELGIKVITASSGFDAIEIISKDHANKDNRSHAPIDLIFMDIQMPRMSGHEAAMQIRNITPKDGTRIPIIALTAHGLSDERDKLMASGIDDYVGKPIGQPQLLQVLQKWLGKQHALPHLPESPLPDSGSLMGGLLASGGDSSSAGHLDAETVQETAAETNDVLEHDGAAGSNAVDVLDTLTVIDWEDALTRSANKPDLAAKLIIMMIDSIKDEKSALKQAWEAQDRSALAQISHRILGASRYTGVPQVRQASQNFEDKCLLNVQHESLAQFLVLKPSYEALLKALSNLEQADLSPWPQLNYHRLSENDMTWKMI